MQSMTHNKTLLLVWMAFLLLSPLHAQDAGHYIWGGPNATGAEYDNSTFNGGLNDWTTEGIQCNDPAKTANAVWSWSEDGKLDGAFWPNDGHILNSPSVDNGVVGFDSDYLDCAGIPGGYGQGDAPSPQISYLTSPSIDCTGETDVQLLFYQSYRKFVGTCQVQVSVDGGTSWTTFAIALNDGLEPSESTMGQVYVDISTVADNQSDVKIRFSWDGNYYFWEIDDVALVSGVESDLSITDFIYPVTGLFKPILVANVAYVIEHLAFDFRNAANVAVSDLSVVAEIKNPSGVVIYSESQFIGTLASDYAVHNVTFPNFSLSNPDPGIYTYSYRIISNANDFTPEDNMDEGVFVISDHTFANGTQVTRLPFPLEPEQQYSVGTAFLNESFSHGGLELAVDSLGFYVAAYGNVPLHDVALVVGFSDAIDPQSCILNLNINVNNHSDITVGEATQTPQLIWVTEFLDQWGTPQDIIMEPEKLHLALLTTNIIKNGNEKSGLAFGFTDEIKYAPVSVYSVPKNIYAADGSLTDWPSGLRPGVPHIILKLKFLTDSKQPKLPENVLKVIPNPVKDVLHLELQFDNSTDVNYAIGTMTGSILNSGYWQGVQSNVKHLDVSHLANGQYLIRIQTKDGIATKTFTIMK